MKAIESAVDDMRTRFREIAKQADDAELSKVLKEFSQGSVVDSPEALGKLDMVKWSSKIGMACS